MCSMAPMATMVENARHSRSKSLNPDGGPATWWTYSLTSPLSPRRPGPVRRPLRARVGAVDAGGEDSLSVLLGGVGVAPAQLCLAEGERSTAVVAAARRCLVGVVGR